MRPIGRHERRRTRGIEGNRALEYREPTSIRQPAAHAVAGVLVVGSSVLLQVARTDIAPVLRRSVGMRNRGLRSQSEEEREKGHPKAVRPEPHPRKARMSS